MNYSHNKAREIDRDVIRMIRRSDNIHYVAVAINYCVLCRILLYERRNNISFGRTYYFGHCISSYRLKKCLTVLTESWTDRVTTPLDAILDIEFRSVEGHDPDGATESVERLKCAHLVGSAQWISSCGKVTRPSYRGYRGQRGSRVLAFRRFCRPVNATHRSTARRQHAATISQTHRQRSPAGSETAVHQRQGKEVPWWSRPRRWCSIYRPNPSISDD